MRGGVQRMKTGFGANTTGKALNAARLNSQAWYYPSSLKHAFCPTKPDANWSQEITLAGPTTRQAGQDPTNAELQNWLAQNTLTQPYTSTGNDEVSQVHKHSL